MIQSPFAILRPFEDVLSVVLLTREDHVHTDKEMFEKFKDGSGEVPSRLVSLHQVHGNRTIVVSEATSRSEQADGLVTDRRDLILTIRTADCQSILAFDPKRKVLGILHCGWRGLVCAAIPSFVATFTDHYQSDPHDLLVGCGPSLCKRCATFTNPKEELTGIPERFFDGANADLQRIADWQLTECGVTKEHIERSPDCTKCQNDLYWSYRGTDRDAVKEGWTNVLAAWME